MSSVKGRSWLNLTRFGDLLQSQALIHDLHDSGHRVGLVCLDNFSPAVPLLRHVDRAWPLPGGRVMALIEQDWRQAAAFMLNLAHSIRHEGSPTHIINLTATLPARLLGRLLAPTPDALMGFGLDAEGFGYNESVWLSFLSGAIRQRQSTPFNLVDMFRMAGSSLLASGVAARPGRNSLQQPHAAACARAQEILAAAMPDSGRPHGFVALQLGASEARRQWPVSSFAALGDTLYQAAGLCPVLLGTSSERALAEAYAAAAQGPFVNAVGSTDIPTLAALLTECRLLVTNDTGTMHLAAGLGVPCLAFFLATAQPWDTGPYLPGCCCLEPALSCHPCAYRRACTDDHVCLEYLTPGPVAELILGWLRSGHWEDGLNPELCTRARVWKTESDVRGFAAVRSLSGHDTEERTLWLAWQRFFWCRILDEMSGASPGSMQQNMPLPCPQSVRTQVVPVLYQTVRLLDLLTEQGRLLGKSAQAGQLFLRNCERVQDILGVCQPLASLGFFWRELRQERGGRMDELLQFTAQLSAHLRFWAAALEGDTKRAESELL